jgi:hypothetical protein
MTLVGSQSLPPVTTDSSGNYSFTNLTAGGNFAVTPSLTGYTFSPTSSASIFNLNSNITANFTATPTTGTVTISGQVTVSGTGLNGVGIYVNGTLSATTNSTGNFTTAQLAKGGNYALTAALTGYGFSGPYTFTALTSNTTQNFTGMPGLQYYPVSPCRLVDTRVSSFPTGFGPPSLVANATRTFNLPSNGTCGNLSSALAYSLNITAPTHGYLGILTLWPAGQTMPNVSTLNSYSTSPTAVANAAIVPAGTNGGISVQVTDPTDLIVDIDGYFGLPSTGGYDFIPVSPCRLVDTRVSSMPAGFGPPTVPANGQRSFTVPSNNVCAIPTSAKAYSLNVTAVPQKTLGLLTIWQTGTALPNESTLNVYTPGITVANAAIVPAGTGGAFSVYASDATDLVIDINGYFAPHTSSSLKLYTLTPCRVADTRVSTYPANLGAPTMVAGAQRSFPVPSSTCAGIPSNAGAYSFNFTAVPQASRLGIFTVWPTGSSLPNVSTMNSYNGSVVANAAIVPAGTAGAISIYVTDKADVLFDINGYFSQ